MGWQASDAIQFKLQASLVVDSVVDVLKFKTTSIYTRSASTANAATTTTTIYSRTNFYS